MFCPGQKHGIVILGYSLPGISEFPLLSLLLRPLLPECLSSVNDLRMTRLEDGQLRKALLPEHQHDFKAIRRVADEISDVRMSDLHRGKSEPGDLSFGVQSDHARTER